MKGIFRDLVSSLDDNHDYVHVHTEGGEEPNEHLDETTEQTRLLMARGGIP
jgi:hypothetical protein